MSAPSPLAVKDLGLLQSSLLSPRRRTPVFARAARRVRLRKINHETPLPLQGEWKATSRPATIRRAAGSPPTSRAVQTAKSKTLTQPTYPTVLTTGLMKRHHGSLLIGVGKACLLLHKTGMLKRLFARLLLSTCPRCKPTRLFPPKKSAKGPLFSSLKPKKVYDKVPPFPGVVSKTQPGPPKTRVDSNSSLSTCIKNSHACCLCEVQHWEVVKAGGGRRKDGSGHLA